MRHGQAQAAAEARRLSKFPSLHLSSETKPSPVHDQAPGKAVGIGRGTGRSGEGGARGVERSRTHGFDRTIVKVVVAAKRVGEVRHGPADRLLQFLLGARDRVLLVACGAIPKPDVIDRVGADRRGVAGRQLAEFLGGERSGVRRRSGTYLPLLRDSVEGPLECPAPEAAAGGGGPNRGLP